MSKKAGVAAAFMGAFIIICIIGGFLYIQKDKQSQSSTQEYMQKVQRARDIFSSGEYALSIDQVRALITSAPDKTEAGRLQLLLASSLVARNQEGDAAQATVILQKIYNDYSVASWVRALALNNLAVLVLAHTSSFYTKNITELPFSTYLSSSSSTDYENVSRAYLQILQLSDETYPTSAAEYAIAGNYYAYAILNFPPSDTEQKNIAKKMQNYIAEADKRDDKSFYTPTGLILNQLNRAFALNVSGTILGNKTLNEQEDAYKAIFSVADTNNISNPVASASLLVARFLYADFLMRNFNSTRNTDIQLLLLPFGQITSTNAAFGWLAALKNLPDSSYTKKEALALGKISPEFKQFLLATGVQAH
jgi:hypothetical protein